MTKLLVVPPGGFTGFSQMTPASRAALSGGMTRSQGNRAAARTGYFKRKKRKKSSGKKRRTKRDNASRRVGPKFGSPAWHKKYKTGKFRKK